MNSIFLLLFILFAFLLISRIATVALHLTGLSLDSARFQARSALTGVGFTTKESELITQHPVRRRIIMMLMYVGNTGIVTLIVSLFIAFMGLEQQSAELWKRVLIISVGVMTLTGLARSRWIDRKLVKVIVWALQRWTVLEVWDYATLMQLSMGYGIVEVTIKSDDKLWVNKALKDLNLKQEGILILGIFREDKTYIGAPTSHTTIHANDTLILYGKTNLIKKKDHFNEVS